MTAKNTGISKPRSYTRRPNNVVKAGFVRKDSVMNSHFNMNLFGSANSSNRKQATYNSISALSTGQDTSTVVKGNIDPNKEIRQSNLEANVGQMDRINRLKATNIKNSK